MSQPAQPAQPTRPIPVQPGPVGRSGSPRRAASGASPEVLRAEDGPLDHYTRLVQRLLRSPVALVSVIDGEDQLMPGASGLSGEVAGTRRSPVTHSLCRHVVRGGAPLVVGDARADERLAREPAVTEYGILAYAGFPLRTADGQVVGSLCAVDTAPREWGDDDLETLRDLSLACSAELQQRRAAQATSEALTQALLDDLDVMVVFYDADNRLVLANGLARAAAEAAGMSFERPPYAGTHVRAADNRTPVAPEDQLLPRALRGEEQEFEMTWYGELGHERAVAASSRRLHHADGRFWGTLVTAHDVTELARALQVKESFVSTVSHELRTPLAAVIGYAELLGDELVDLDGDTGAATQALGVIRRRAADLQTRIADLLDMTDLRRRLSLHSTDLGDLARRVVSGFADAAYAAGHHLDLRVDGPQRAQVDEQRVTQVLENLVSNAIKYAGPGTIAVGVSGTEERVVLEVVDDGVGMPPGDADQAFDKFWRAPEAHAAAVPGIGIGLSLVRDIAEAHHGNVTLDSLPGRGTSVRVVLPRSPAAVS